MLPAFDIGLGKQLNQKKQQKFCKVRWTLTVNHRSKCNIDDGFELQSSRSKHDLNFMALAFIGLKKLS